MKRHSRAAGKGIRACGRSAAEPERTINFVPLECAIAVAQPKDRGRFGPQRFIACEADRRVPSAEFLRDDLLNDEEMEKIGKASPGGAGRNGALALETPIPAGVPGPSAECRRTFDALQPKVEPKSRHAAIHDANTVLVPPSIERLLAAM